MAPADAPTESGRIGLAEKDILKNTFLGYLLKENKNYSPFLILKNVYFCILKIK